MRGKVSLFERTPHELRITPAYAGKSLSCVQRSKYFKDHPRLCGEKLTFFRLYSGDMGSPPPMRGKALTISRYIFTIGITPAYAGKSFPSENPYSVIRDHPRLCGEKSGILRANAATTGSPPPMRGKVNGKTVREHHKRITPAYAGKSSGRL